jgi:hypothetical protein
MTVTAPMLKEVPFVEERKRTDRLGKRQEDVKFVSGTNFNRQLR